ncbi:MAG: glycosyltransferase family 9 protein [Desulfovibrionaceae bacterium]|nr:glycosyltransferase family 9 protein [Desulfovibrionaceae bacterium]
MPLDCLVINLTRFGDLLQSQPLFHDLKNHGLKTGLLCLENFASTLPLLTNIDQTFTLKGARILSDLEQNWPHAAASLLQLAQEIRATNPRYIINLTATIAARLLTKLIADQKAQIIGFGLDSDGFGLNTGAWATFLAATTSCRQNSVFNIVDMFRGIGRHSIKNTPYEELGGLNKPTSTSLNDFEKFLSTSLDRLKLSNPPKGFIAMQLGASEERRMWPIEYFASLGDEIWAKTGFMAILTGAKGEKKLAQAYAACAKEPFIDGIGATNLSVLAALLSRVKLLVSNDTGTMHLAAGLGTPSLGFFLATAQPWDTGPYLTNCLCLEPDLPCHPCQFKTTCPYDFKCRQTIEPKPVAELITNYLEKGLWQALQDDPPIRIWQTTLDENNLALIFALSKHNNADRTLFILHQRNFWRQVLDALEKITPGKITTLPPCQESFCQKITPVMDQVNKILPILLEQGNLLLQNKPTGKLFLRNCDRIQTLLSTNQHLLSLGHFWRELRTDLSQNLPALLLAIEIFSRNFRQLRHALEFGTECA